MPKEYTESDFNLDNFHEEEFEMFCCDFLSTFLGKNIGYITHFPEGKDGGVDGFYEDETNKIIMQAKRHKKPLTAMLLKAEKSKMDIQKPTDYYFFVSHQLSRSNFDSYFENLQPHIKTTGHIFDRKKMFEQLKNNQKKYKYLMKKWLSRLAETGAFFMGEKLKIESEEKIQREIKLVNEELEVKNNQINSLINTLEKIAGETKFVGIEARVENEPNLSEPILFSEYYQNKVKTYYQTEKLTPDQVPIGGFIFDFSKEGGQELKQDLQNYLKGKKDYVKITNKFLKKINLQIQGKTIFDEEVNHGDLADKITIVELRQVSERLKIRIDPLEGADEYSLDSIEAIAWRSVETGNLIIENVPLIEKPKIKFKFEIDINTNTENTNVKITTEILNDNLDNFEEALFYYKLWERILSKSWSLKIITSKLVQTIMDNTEPASSLDEEDIIFIKKLEILYKVWKYYEKEFRRLRIDEDFYSLKHPYNLTQDSGQTLAILHNKIDNFKFEVTTPIKNFKEHNLPTAGELEIKPMSLFNKNITLKIRGANIIHSKKINDDYVNQTIEFNNPEIRLDLVND